VSWYLGIDVSTQSLTAVVIDSGVRRVILEHAFAFDRELPEYGTRAGVLPSNDPRVAHAPPLMWADALDRMCAALRGRVDMSRIRAISGSAQQHGSVYLSRPAADVLNALDPSRPLADQIRAMFSRPASPLWLDCSTSAQCASLTAALGGDHAVARLTGSRAYERFTAAQIRKFAEEEPGAYAATARIHLVSSFMASLLIGADAPLEPADASGMNLMDLRTRHWAAAALDATAPALGPRLPPIGDSSAVVGAIDRFWRRRFGFGDAKVVAWTGDNPASLVGLGLTRIGDVAVSLGTSDTIFGPCDDAAVEHAGSGHVFASPVGGSMALVCFANGSLAREYVRDTYRLDWEAFSSRLRQTSAGNDGGLMLPWVAPEITPPATHAGIRRRGFGASDAGRNVRGLVEGQACAMRLHSRWIAPDVRSIRATGGASANRDVLQVIADVFGAEVLSMRSSNAAALGAAIRAWYGDAADAGQPLSWDEAVAGFIEPDSRVNPDQANAPLYQRVLRDYEAFERECLQQR
jgi:xylulokinase